MSEENVEVVRRGFDAFAEGNLDAMLELLTDDIRWDPGIGPLLGISTVRGKDAVRRLLTIEIPDSIENFEAEALSFEDLGSDVLAHVRFSGRGRGSGISVSQQYFTLYSVRNGKGTRMRDFPSREEALAAAGLSE